MKRINPRLAKLHRSYDVFELADLLGVHRHTVRGWIKAGLPTVDGTRPVLIHGDEFQAWWQAKRDASKRPCEPGQLFCFKCREPKRPALGMVEYDATNGRHGQSQGALRNVRHDDASAGAAGCSWRGNARSGRETHAGSIKHMRVGQPFPEL